MLRGCSFRLTLKNPRPKSGPVTYDQVVASVVREEQKIEKINDTGENEEKTGPKPVCCMMCATLNWNEMTTHWRLGNTIVLFIALITWRSDVSTMWYGSRKAANF